MLFGPLQQLQDIHSTYVDVYMYYKVHRSIMM